VKAKFSAPILTSSGAHPASHTVGTSLFSGIKQLQGGVNHPPPSSTKVKERVKLYLYSLPVPSWQVIGRTSPLHIKYWYISCVSFKQY